MKLLNVRRYTHSSLYCWISPSGKSLEGNSSSIGIDGGSVWETDGVSLEVSVCTIGSFFFLYMKPSQGHQYEI